MRKLDFRTLVVALGIFGLGYAICLAMPIAKADKPEVSEITVDRILVGHEIQFGSENGPMLYIPYPEVNGLNLWLHGALRAELENGRIGANVLGGRGLDVGKLGSYSAEDFVLKSEIDDNFCQVFCSPDILIKPPLQVEPTQ